ncbi:hypothetical protein R6L23_13595 [Streptomyces sp. SR27]|uniref:hypothetical protein n=1 Tax=unclassified Streptomyces TaxID=2593676 RepID=UPI00295B9A42|nr:hypothetical protein [Streptomyces sp. SR27]MDV9189232.1 hypothetical protein [Streptomyces sp. SR27]
MRKRRRTTTILAGLFAGALLIGAAAQLAKVSADAPAARTVAMNKAELVGA